MVQPVDRLTIDRSKGLACLQPILEPGTLGLERLVGMNTTHLQQTEF